MPMIVTLWPIPHDMWAARLWRVILLDRRLFLAGSALAIVMSADLAAAALSTRVVRKARVAGAAGPIEIVDDQWGIPHIRAGSKADAYFGQGYCVARDRLFQIDYGHRREMGRLAEVFGPKFADFDAAMRLFHYRGNIDAELASVPAEVRACAEGYLNGVNARIAEVEADPTLLPPEYAILGIRPMRWTLRDFVVARGAAIGNMDDEIRRARLAAMGLLDLDALVAPLRPAWTMTVPAGLDTAAVSDADLGALAVLTRALPFASSTPAVEADMRDARDQAGSNAWTVAGSRTATGRPTLANDPHLGIGGFSPRHVAHLTAPGLDVIGGGAPGLPGIMQGHTDRFAFGRTNFHIDQEDLYILELHPDDPEMYRHDGGWKRFDRHEEVIGIAGASDRVETVRYSVQGPVVMHDPARRRASAVASVMMLPGSVGWFSMVAINLAHDWESLKQAFRLHPSPTNFHYADVDGNTGWQVIGYAPLRKQGDGLFPVPGDGAYDWTGRIMFDSLPSSYNPATGWFASANQDNIPPDYPFKEHPLAFSFRDPYRYDRIAEVLEGQPKHTIADSVALQHDVVSTPARQLVAMLPETPSPDAAPAARMLADWNGHVDGDSGAAALFEIVWRELDARMRDAVVPDRAKSLVTSLSPGVMLGFLAHPDARLGADPAAARDALFDAALASGWVKATRLMGEDPAAWRWATLHRVRIQHPLSSIPAIARAFPAIEGEGSGGDAYTPMARWVSSAGWRVTGGASYLMVCDVGKWENSVMLLLPGQSAEPASPHYRDFYKPWIEARMQPLLFDRKAIDAAATRRTELTPA